jgi:hypothetical protein
VLSVKKCRNNVGMSNGRRGSRSRENNEMQARAEGQDVNQSGSRCQREREIEREEGGEMRETREAK